MYEIKYYRPNNPNRETALVVASNSSDALSQFRLLAPPGARIVNISAASHRIRGQEATWAIVDDPVPHAVAPERWETHGVPTRLELMAQITELEAEIARLRSERVTYNPALIAALNAARERTFADQSRPDQWTEAELRQAAVEPRRATEQARDVWWSRIRDRFIRETLDDAARPSIADMLRNTEARTPPSSSPDTFED